MNEEQIPQNDQQSSPPIIPDAAPAGQTVSAETIPTALPNKPPYTFWGFATLFYVVVLLLMVAIPDLSGILFWVELAGGVAVGIHFFSRMVKLKPGNSLVRIFFVLVGIGGGFLLFCASTMAGLVAYFSAHPLQGD